MANPRSYTRSFGGGEVTPEFFGRVDDVRHATGLETCRNFIVKPHGPVENRAGFGMVREVKDSTKRTRLIPFIYADDQTVVIEIGEGYFRFHTQGATITSGGSPYEVSNTYAEADIPNLRYVQSNDVITLTHPLYPVKELRRNSATSWSFSTVSFAPSISAPTGVSATAHPATTSPGDPSTHSYVVTAIKEQGAEESVASSAASCSNNIFDDAAYNTISWSAVGGATGYYVYKLSGGLYGYIGQTSTATSMNDDNIAPDVSKTPPTHDTPISTANNYPGAVGYFEQRRCFAGSVNKPASFWATKSGTEKNLSYSTPQRDDDRVSFTIAARERNEIRHIVPMANLVLLTEAAEWRVAPAEGEVLTPNVSVRPQSFVGSSYTQPIVVNNNLIFAAARGGHARELAYSIDANGYVTGDLSLRAPHLFDNHAITEFTYAKAPYPVVWCVSSSGNLLGFTYVPEQQVGAWHRHDTKNGLFESVAAVSEGGSDALYAIVKRTIGGETKRFVERMAARDFVDVEDCFFVDCGKSYHGNPATVISGLDHLEGETVVALADGAYTGELVVTGGAVTLETAASTVHVGLPITADLKTLPLAIDAMAFGQGATKDIAKLWARVYRSRNIKAGPSYDLLLAVEPRSDELYGTPPTLKTGQYELAIDGTWTEEGQLCIRQDNPLPLTVVSLTIAFAFGG